MDDMAETLDALAALSADSKEFYQLCHSPLFSSDDKCKAVTAIAKHLSLSPVVTLWLEQLAENNRLALLPAIRNAFKVLQRDAKGEVQVTITSARALKPTDFKALSDAIAKTLGKPVDPVAEVDEGLIAGLTIRVGSTELDASVKGKLARAAERLYEGIQN